MNKLVLGLALLAASLTACSNQPVTLVLVQDCSASAAKIVRPGLTFALKSAHDLLNGPQDTLVLFRAAGQVTNPIDQPAPEDALQLRAALTRATAKPCLSRGSRVGEATLRAAERAQQASSPVYIAIITDGELADDPRPQLLTQAARLLATDADVKRVAVIGNSTQPDHADRRQHLLQLLAPLQKSGKLVVASDLDMNANLTSFTAP